MPDDCAQLQALRSRCLQQLLELRADPKPSYSIDGQSVSWQSYAESLQQSIDWCDQKLRQAEPFEIQSQGVAE